MEGKRKSVVVELGESLGVKCVLEMLKSESKIKDSGIIDSGSGIVACCGLSRDAGNHSSEKNEGGGALHCSFSRK